MDATTKERPAVETLAPADHVQRWLTALERALQRESRADLQALFVEHCHWRDLVALTWNITPHVGRDDVVAGLLQSHAKVRARGFAIACGRTPPRRVQRLGREVVEAIFDFETAEGRGSGIVRLPVDAPDQAWVFMTSLQELKGYEEPIGTRRPTGAEGIRMFGGPAWAERRAREQAFEDREPAVLVVGAGQAGLNVAARLRLAGVDALVIDALPRVGDVWRTRYEALALHNQVSLNHLAYLPFPPSWPKYLPKDMLGNWLETYAQAMECNVWTSTTLVEGRHDERTGAWSARVRRDDGSERVLHPRHIVFANGVVGAPKKAVAPCLDDFRGEVIHTHTFKSGAAWRGKKALVLGAGTSGHDIAQDLFCSGAAVQLIQRGSITVASVDAAGLNHAVYYREDLPLADCDLIAASSTYPLLVRGYQLNVAKMQEIDKDLIAGLQARGMKLDFGDDGTGHQMKLRRRFGGYYLNCGASDLIVRGDIGLMQYENIERFVPEGVLMKDGRVESADLLVTATGYHNQQEVVRDILGPEIAEKVGQIWGIDHDGELANMFRPTPQKGLWFIGGGLAHARIYSHYIALQIKAREAGLIS
jgi:cation diffusion facilitator CzcD-associated flavoprotein CzcO